MVERTAVTVKNKLSNRNKLRGMKWKNDQLSTENTLLRSMIMPMPTPSPFQIPLNNNFFNQQFIPANMRQNFYQSGYNGRYGF